MATIVEALLHQQFFTVFTQSVHKTNLSRFLQARQALSTREVTKGGHGK